MITLYAETVLTNHTRVGFPPFTGDTIQPASRYLVEYDWDERSGPTPQVSASQFIQWDPVGETNWTTVVGSITPDMYYGGDAPTYYTNADGTEYGVSGP